MKALGWSLVLIGWSVAAMAAPPRALPAGQLPDDVRLGELKDLNGYFPFDPPKTKEAWAARADFVRRQMQVALGLWPMPTKTPLNAVLHGKIDKPEYTIEKGYFESMPGVFVTGNLYRPKGFSGKRPVVLFAHGHWKDARLSEVKEDALRKEIAEGQERFEEGGRSRFQSLCVQAARMGCIVWQWDMMSDSDAIQLSAQVVHRFAKQRPEMNAAENWGFFSPQAEANLQSILGLQSLNAVRSLDFVLSLPDVDPARVAVTGASGGGTQTMILAAIDPRITLSFPVVMVSTAMQGGCTCENASLLRVETGNVEFAGLFAPKPQGMNTANDWTKELATKGFPELQELYKQLGQPKNVMLLRGEHFPHNYNSVTRSAFFTWLNHHFQLGQKSPVIERDYEFVKGSDLTVWDDAHPAPKAGDPEFERRMLRWWRDDEQKQLDAAADSLDSFKKLAGAAVEAILVRGLPNEKALEMHATGCAQEKMPAAMVSLGSIWNTERREELPVAWLVPQKPDGRVVLWLDDAGKAGLFDNAGMPKPEIAKLLNAGVTVLGADLFLQGEFLKDGQPVTQNRVVANPREFAGYTYGYNHSLFAQRTHDVLTLVQFVATQGLPGGKKTAVRAAGFGACGPILAAARAVAGPKIARAAVDSGAFRFGQLTDYRDVRFLPGGAKYGDLPGLLALGAPNALWLAGEGPKAPALVEKIYQAAKGSLTVPERPDRGAAAAWLLAE